MPEVRDVAVAFGIANAEDLPYMGGALNGAREFHNWASRLGYDSRLVTDENQPVTVARFRTELEAALMPLSQRIHRFLIYFAGHGLIREAEEGLWLLSDWSSELKAVAVEALKRRLYMHDIEQIAIFSDSCRSLPPNITVADLAPDPVLGRGPLHQLVQPAIDKFIATQDGYSAFMVPGPNPEDDRCIFTGVLMEGLWGIRKEAFSKVNPENVTSRSLGTYLKTEVPKQAQVYKRNLLPSVSPTFPEDDDIYFGNFRVSGKPTPPVFQPWPSPNAILTMAPIEEEKASTILIDKIRNQPRPQNFETGAGFAVEGGQIKALWTKIGVIAERHGQPNWWRLSDAHDIKLLKSEPILIEFEDGICAATTALPGFIASVLRDHRGIMAQVYRPVPEDTYLIQNVVALAFSKMESGALRTDDAIDLAVELRMQKHRNPVLGVISAYLYDSIGDIDNIRRMAFYYVQNEQLIPYDIALLGQLSGESHDSGFSVHVPPVAAREARTDAEKSMNWTYEKTPEVSGEVGGLWPWLRQGWMFLDDPSDSGLRLIHPELKGLLQYLKPSRFATFSREGGRALAQIFNLVTKHESI